MGRRLVFDSTMGEGRFVELVYKRQLLYEDCCRVSVTARPWSQVTEDNPRVRELKSQIAKKEIKRVAAVAVAASSERKSDALKVQNAGLDSEVTRLHSEIDAVKQFRAEVAKLSLVVQKVAISLTGSANLRVEAVERADNLSTQLAASNRRKDAYKSEKTAAKEDSVKLALCALTSTGQLANWSQMCVRLLPTLVAHFGRLSRARIVPPRTLLTRVMWK